MLVKNPKAKNKKANIYYREVDDYQTREEKLAAVLKTKSVTTAKFTQRILKPNENNDWLNQRSNIFNSLICLGDKKNTNDNKKTFFCDYYSQGIVTNRDAWCYNFSCKNLGFNIQKTIHFYNEERLRYLKSKDSFSFVYDKTKITWVQNTKKYLLNNVLITYDKSRMTFSMYRPFCKQNFYYENHLNWSSYLMHKLFFWNERNKRIKRFNVKHDC